MSNIRLLSVLPHRFALSHSLIVEKHLFTQAFVRFKTICISYLTIFDKVFWFCSFSLRIYRRPFISNSCYQTHFSYQLTLSNYMSRALASIALVYHNRRACQGEPWYPWFVFDEKRFQRWKRKKGFRASPDKSFLYLWYTNTMLATAWDTIPSRL